MVRERNGQLGFNCFNFSKFFQHTFMIISTFLIGLWALGTKVNSSGWTCWCQCSFHNFSLYFMPMPMNVPVVVYYLNDCLFLHDLIGNYTTFRDLFCIGAKALYEVREPHKALSRKISFTSFSEYIRISMRSFILSAIFGRKKHFGSIHTVPLIILAKKTRTKHKSVAQRLTSVFYLKTKVFKLFRSS